MESNSIASNAKRSMVWSFIEKASVQGLGFIVSLILARLLSPEDYGVIAIIMVFGTIANVFIDCGILKALIQNQNCGEKDYSTALYTNILLGLTCYIALFFLSPLIADFFEIPSLCDTTRVYGIVLIVTSLNVVQRARYQKEYNFRTITVISLIALIVGGACGLYQAFTGFGVWSLVSYYLIMEVVRTLLYWILGGWWPVMVFSRSSFNRIFKFGSKLLAANMLHIIIYNLYTFVIGKMFSANILGLYSRGQSISNIFPANMSYVMEQASYPILCNVQNDKELLKSYFRRYIQFSFAITAPLCMLLAVLAKPLVVVILTEKWIDAVFYIQVLSIAYAFDPIMRLNAIVINTTGKSEYSLYSEIVKKFVFVITILTTCLFGIKTMACGMVFNSFADIFIVTFFVKKVANYTLIDEIKDLLPYFIGSLLMMICVWSFSFIFINEYHLIIFGSILGIMVYIVSIMILAPHSCSSLVEYIKSSNKK